MQISKPGRQRGFNLRELGQTGRAYLLLLPALSVVGLLFGGGLILALLQSLGLLTILGSGQPNLAAYRSVFASSEVWRSLWLSFYIAVVSTGLSTILSVGLALLLRSAGRWASFACQITLPIPHLVGVTGMLLLLSPSGLLSRIAFTLGWIQSDQNFPLLVNDVANIGVILHFLWKEIPFITLILLAVLRGINPGYETQARALGANRWQCFWNVTFPMMKPGILSSSLIVFGYIFSSFEVPFLLGSTRPRTLPVLVYRSFTDSDLASRPEAIALGLILAVIAIGLIVVYLQITSRRQT
ncbi:ABC transporter permease subunit [Leptolyngbya sp. FACHB-711]|uniref:ABC transporter permease subunit n=1 Tax=unclassified Leptolyngbya TaxID=2650499 RepID=UPI0016878F03|nr:ABC transporter permease subunit [Cyanobacteria bacterium FACHB-502]MBD2025749.1 ABC transporter permease subunit [Leptolyngbya sp. FACHB-711]